MQRDTSRGHISPLEEQDNLANMARCLGNIGWEKRLCDLTKEEVLGIVTYIQKMRILEMSLAKQDFLNLNRVSPVLTPKTTSTTPFHSDAIELISYNIDKGICEKNDAQPKRKYLGGSSLGSVCAANPVQV